MVDCKSWREDDNEDDDEDDVDLNLDAFPVMYSTLAADAARPSVLPHRCNAIHDCRIAKLTGRVVLLWWWLDDRDIDIDIDSKCKTCVGLKSAMM